jgi:YebC/PmpR family DNA-binding regulatory protein
MSGHSKWASIKHKKGALDAKRGKVFTRLIKELTVAARAGGGDPDMNPRLRTIIADAKSENMPSENIKRAIRRGTGEEPGVSYEEAQYEAYGPGGAAVIIDVLTDNKNRTVGELRHSLEKHGGNLASTNAVAWMFTKKGYIIIEKAKAAGVDEDTLMAAVLDAGADDLQDDDDNWEVFSTPDAFQAVRDAVKHLGIEPASAQVSMIPQNYVKLEGKTAQQMLRLMDVLDDHDDVQHVWANFDIEEKEIEASLA